MHRFLPLLLLAIPCWTGAAPLEVKMCIFDHPFPPLTYPDGSGQAQDVLRRASRLQPVQIQPVVAPRFQVQLARVSSVQITWYSRVTGPVTRYGPSSLTTIDGVPLGCSSLTRTPSSEAVDEACAHERPDSAALEV